MTSMRILMREPSKPKRDFLKENRRQVKKIEEQLRELRISGNQQQLKSSKYEHVQPKVQTRSSRPSTSAPVPRVTGNRPSSAYYAASEATTCDEGVQCSEISVCIDQRDQSTQTEEDPREDRILRASACPWEQRSQLRLDLNDAAIIDGERPECLNQATQRTASSGSGPKAIGWQPVDAGDKSSCSERPCPTASSGISSEQSSHVLSEEKSGQTLSQLRAIHAKLISELNALPVRSNTLRVQHRRRDIETELDKVEGLITALTKPF